MNQLPILIRREFWENRVIFLVLPIIISGFFLFIMSLTVLVAPAEGVDLTLKIEGSDDIQLLDDSVQSDNIYILALYRLEGLPSEERVRYVNTGLQILAGPLIIVLWFVIFVYLLNSLYADRRDRSIFFWKSMPVSDSITVFSKLLTGLWLVPVFYLFCVAVLQAAALVIIGFVTIGTEISMRQTIWEPVSLFSNWMQYIWACLLYSFWAMPFFGWLILVSAYSKSVPLVWVVTIPSGLAVIEKNVIDQSLLSDWLWNHTDPMSFIDMNKLNSDAFWNQVVSLQMASAIIVGGLLIAIAIWVRGRVNET